MIVNSLPGLIQSALSKYHPISDRTSQALAEVTELKSYQEGEIIEEENRAVVAEYLIIEGILRSFIVNQKGDDVSNNFYTSAIAVTPSLMRSYNDRAFYNLQVLVKNTQVLVFNRKGINDQMERFVDLEKFGQAVMMMDAKQRVEHEMMLLKASGKEKLEWFRKRYPNLENEIQHYHIASFLGLTSTSLSRIRAIDDR